MGEPYLTMAEIEKRYADEWVLIDRPRVDQFNDVVGGRVEWHHPDRDEFDRELPAHPLADAAILFAGIYPIEPIYLITPWMDDSIED